MKHITQRAFTIVELIVIIGVIGILATVAVLGFGRFQNQARDAERQADIGVIVESLEKYYDENGEYPSCSALTAGGATVAQTLDLQDAAVLASPRLSADNAFVCGALAQTTDTDNYAYVGDGSQTCLTGGSCLRWTLQYRSDEDGSIKTVESRRVVAVGTSGEVNVTATVISASQINLVWGAIPNASSYTIERSVNADLSASATTTTSGTTANYTGLTSGERYYFRVTPTILGQSGTPGTADATTTIANPTGTLATASTLVSGTTARGTASGVSCAAGTTLQYQIGVHARNANVAVSLAYGAWGTAATRDAAASQGYNYSFQSRARCAGSDATSGTLTSATTNVTRPIDSPPTPVFYGDTSWLAGYKYDPRWYTYCPAGTSLTEGVQFFNTGYSGSTRYPSSGNYQVSQPDWWYLGWAAGQTFEDVYYYGFYRCSTYFSTSPWSPTSAGTRITVECEPARRSYNVSPRCDNHGQPASAIPFGP